MSYFLLLQHHPNQQPVTVGVFGTRTEASDAAQARPGVYEIRPLRSLLA